MSHKQDDDPKGADALREIGLRLGGLFAGLRDALDAAANAGGRGGDGRGDAEQGGDGRRDADQGGAQDIEIQTSKGPLTAKVSYGVRTSGLFGGGLADAAETGFSNRSARRSQSQPTASASPTPRRAEIELFEEADALTAVAEFPGAAPEDLRVALDGAVLRLTVDGPRRFAAEAAIAPEIAARLDAGRLESRLANGVAEIRIPFAADAAEAGAAAEPTAGDPAP